MACERNRTNPAPVCLQKTVYGANVIVFEGILAFANKELLKVSLPPVATGLERCAAAGQALALGAPAAMGAVEGEVTALAGRALRARGLRGGDVVCHCGVVEGSDAGVMRAA